MIKQQGISMFVKRLFFCASIGPVLGSACVEGTYVERTIDRHYSSRVSPVAFPVARHLGLGDSCYGRRLYKVQMWASTSAGAGLATLLVNGRPAGVTQQLDSTVKLYEFPLDLDYNYMGSNLNMASMEIRLAGDFYVRKVAAVVNDPNEDIANNDPWANYGILLSQTPIFGQELTKTTFEVRQTEEPFKMLVFVARNASVLVKSAEVYFTDGTHKIYGETLIPEGEARRMDNVDCKIIHRVVINAQTTDSCDCSTGYLEFRALYPESEANSFFGALPL